VGLGRTGRRGAGGTPNPIPWSAFCASITGKPNTSSGRRCGGRIGPGRYALRPRRGVPGGGRGGGNLHAAATEATRREERIGVASTPHRHFLRCEVKTHLACHQCQRQSDATGRGGGRGATDLKTSVPLRATTRIIASSPTPSIPPPRLSTISRLPPYTALNRGNYKTTPVRSSRSLLKTLQFRSTQLFGTPQR